jgi:Domain of unknown function (DUF1840)
VIYKFKCKATGDLIMLGPQGDELLRLLGREPAARGIIDTADLPAAQAALEAAMARVATDPTPPQDDDAKANPPVGLRQRLWPMVEMLRLAHAAGQPVVWGV